MTDDDRPACEPELDDRAWTSEVRAAMSAIRRAAWRARRERAREDGVSPWAV